MSKEVFDSFTSMGDREVQQRVEKILDGIEQVIADIYASNPNGIEAQQEKRQLLIRFAQIRRLWLTEKRIVPEIDINTIELVHSLEVSDRVVAQFEQLCADLRPDLAQTYSGTARLEQLEQIIAEGRGAYRTHQVEIDSATLEVVHYVKGLGNKELAIQQAGQLFSAYPSHPDRLFFDDTASVNSHPRIVGTETALWGAHEHINAIVLFGLALKQLNITSIDQAIELGIPIPIGIQQHPELSVYLQSLLAENYLSKTHWLEKFNLRWIGNWQPFVSVGTLVPGVERMKRFSDIQRQPENMRNTELGFFVDKEVAIHLGKTWKNQLKVGAIFSLASSHGQNIYQAANSHLPIADYSDLIFLGAVKDVEEQLFSDSPLEIFSAHDRRHLALYYSLSSQDGTRPLTIPIHEYDISYQQVIDANAAFWQELREMLGKCAASNQQLAWAQTFFPGYFETAATVLFQEHASQGLEKNWDEGGELQQQLMSKVDWSGMLQETLDKRLQANISNYSVHTLRGLVRADFSQAMCEFIRTGEIEKLKIVPELESMVELAKKIHSHTNESEKNKMAEAYGKLQHGRPFYEIEEDTNLKYKHDVIYLFEQAHLKRAIELFDANKIDALVTFFDCLTLLNTLRVDASDFHPAGEKMDVKQWYAFQLLEANPDQFTELYEQIEYFSLLNHLFAGSAGSLLFSAFSDDGVDPFKFANQQGFTHPRTLIINTMGMLYNRKEVRQLVKYHLDLQQQIIKSIGNSPENLSQIVSELDEAVTEIAANLPILKLCHQMQVLQLARQYAPDQLAERYAQFQSTYRHLNQMGFDKELGWSDIWKKYKPDQWQTLYRELAVVYQIKGFERLAEYCIQHAKAFES